MAILRFNTVQDMFDAYPTAEGDVGRPGSAVPSVNFIGELMKENDWGAAIAFCAYLLPRRVAVAWGCRSLRRTLSVASADDDKALAFAEAWVDQPEEAQRRKALALGNQSNMRSPTTWLALGAGWSGGSVVPIESGHVATNAEQTARAVWVALSIALSRLPKTDANKTVRAWLEDGIRLANGEPASR